MAHDVTQVGHYVTARLDSDWNSLTASSVTLHPSFIALCHVRAIVSVIALSDKNCGLITSS